MRKFGVLNGSTALGLAMVSNNQIPVVQTHGLSGRHRGRELSLKAPVLDKTERA